MVSRTCLNFSPGIHVRRDICSTSDAANRILPPAGKVTVFTGWLPMRIDDNATPLPLDDSMPREVVQVSDAPLVP